MARSEQAIFTNMCMISDGAGNILVQDRKIPTGPESAFPAVMWSRGNLLWSPSSGRFGRKQA